MCLLFGLIKIEKSYIIPIANAGMEKSLYFAGVTMNCYCLFRKQSDSIHKNKNKLNIFLNSAIFFLGTYPIETKTPISKHICSKMFIAASFTVAKN